LKCKENNSLNYQNVKVSYDVLKGNTSNDWNCFIRQ